MGLIRKPCFENLGSRTKLHCVPSACTVKSMADFSFILRTRIALLSAKHLVRSPTEVAAHLLRVISQSFQRFSSTWCRHDLAAPLNAALWVSLHFQRACSWDSSGIGMVRPRRFSPGGWTRALGHRRPAHDSTAAALTMRIDAVLFRDSYIHGRRIFSAPLNTLRSGCFPPGRRQESLCLRNGRMRRFSNLLSSGSRYAGTPITTSDCFTFSLSVPCIKSHHRKITE